MATAAEVVPALRLILTSDGVPGDEAQAGDLIRIMGLRGISLATLWLVEAGGRLLWSCLPMLSPGRSMLLFGAPASVSDPAAMAAGIDAVCDHFADRDVQLAQVLPDPADTATRAAYEGRGFAAIAELLYLTRALRRAPAPPPLPVGLVLHTYGPLTHAGFAAAIHDSYEGSLDCPPLNGVRSMADVIAGHKAAGEFDPADWFLLTRADPDHPDAPVPLGVLLLSRTAGATDAMDLVYLGLTPAARGRGLGSYLLQVAEHRTVQRKRRRLSLAVDAANAPALSLYYRHGFEQSARKLAMMRQLGP